MLACPGSADLPGLGSADEFIQVGFATRFTRIFNLRMHHFMVNRPLHRAEHAQGYRGIRVLQGGQHLAMVIKDGRMVHLNGQEEAVGELALTAHAEG